MSNPIESLLEEDHESLDQLLTELDAELTKPNIIRAFELLDLFWARLAVHIRAEHLRLFPALTEALPQFSGKGGLPASAEVEATLKLLQLDHDFFMKELADMMKDARASGTGGPIAGDFTKRLSAIRKRLETHNRIEEKEVYVWPSLLFDGSTLANLKESLQTELKNLPSRFMRD